MVPYRGEGLARCPRIESTVHLSASMKVLVPKKMVNVIIPGVANFRLVTVFQGWGKRNQAVREANITFYFIICKM